MKFILVFYFLTAGPNGDLIQTSTTSVDLYGQTFDSGAACLNQGAEELRVGLAQVRSGELKGLIPTGYNCLAEGVPVVENKKPGTEI